MELAKAEVPTGQAFGRDRATARLYQLEEKRNAAVKAAAKELGKLLKHREEEFWTRTMPEALYALLDSFSPTVVRVVCETWLARNPARKGDE